MVLREPAPQDHFNLSDSVYRLGTPLFTFKRARISPMLSEESRMTELAQPDQQLDFYQQMRGSIRAWLKDKGAGYQFTEYLLAAPDLFHLLCKIVVDKDVPARERAEIAVAIVYIISPVDFLPEAIVGAIGYSDDVVAAALALNSLVNKTSPEVVMRHWAGDDDVLELIQRILEVAHEMVGNGRLQQIRRSFGRDGDSAA